MRGEVEKYNAHVGIIVMQALMHYPFVGNWGVAFPDRGCDHCGGALSQTNDYVAVGYIICLDCCELITGRFDEFKATYRLTRDADTR